MLEFEASARHLRECVLSVTMVSGEEEIIAQTEVNTAKRKTGGSSDRGELLTLGGTPAPLGGRALIAKVRLVRRGRGPGCFIVRVAGT